MKALLYAQLDIERLPHLLKKSEAHEVKLKAEVLSFQNNPNTQKVTTGVLAGLTEDQKTMVLHCGKTISLMHNLWLPSGLDKVEPPFTPVSEIDSLEDNEKYSEHMLSHDICPYS